jgi:hypothetical protein
MHVVFNFRYQVVLIHVYNNKQQLLEMKPLLHHVMDKLQQMQDLQEIVLK